MLLFLHLNHFWHSQFSNNVLTVRLNLSKCEFGYQKKKKKNTPKYISFDISFFFQRFQHQTHLSLMCLDCLLTQLSKLQTVETGSSTHSRPQRLKSQNALISPQITGRGPSRTDRQARPLRGTELYTQVQVPTFKRLLYRGKKSQVKTKQ